MDWLLIPASGWCAAATPPSPDPAGSSGKARWPPPRRTWRKSRHQCGRAGEDKDEIGIPVGKVIGWHEAGRPFLWEISDAGFTFRRNEDNIAAKARLEGIYVIRAASVPDATDAACIVRIHKNLKYVERDLKTIETDDLNVRPIRHYLATRVETHLLICSPPISPGACAQHSSRRPPSPTKASPTRQPGNPRRALTPGRGKRRRHGNTRRTDPLPGPRPARPPRDADPAGQQFHGQQSRRSPPRSGPGPMRSNCPDHPSPVRVT